MGGGVEGVGRVDGTGSVGERVGAGTTGSGALVVGGDG